MRYFKNDSEFKAACSALDSGFQIDSIRTYVQDQEYKIESLIGEATAEAILSDPDLLEVMRGCVANLALAAYTSSGAVMVSNAGIQVATGSNRAPASDKKLMAFKRDATERGWSNFERLISMLERRKPEAWISSVERKLYLNTLFANSMEFGPFGGVGITATVFQGFKNTIENIQDDLLLPVLGRELLDRLISYNTHLINDVNDKKLQRLCMRIVAPQVVADALRYNAIELNEQGVYQSSVTSGSDNIEAKSSAASSAVMRTIYRLTNESEACLVKLNKFLKEHANVYASSKASVYPGDTLNQELDSNVYFF